MVWTKLNRTDGLRYGYVWCRCSCGVEKQVSKYHIRDGKSNSCGKCAYDLKGVYGKLEVLSFSHSEMKNGRKHSNWWNCKCQCGKLIKKPTTAILTKKAGCDEVSCRFAYGSAAKKALYNTYQRVARNKSLSFSIPFTDFIRLTSENCVYCGSEPTCTQNSNHSNGDYKYNGLDRVDSTKGYELCNIVPCCKYCNSAKSDRPLAEFIAWTRRLANVQLAKPVWEEKCWGRVWHRFNDNVLNESLLEVNEGWCCSTHWHQDRWNCFANIDAVIRIDTFGMSDTDPAPASVRTIILNEGESVAIQPREWHKFSVLKTGKLAELYWTNNQEKCRQDDIVRWDVGGPSQ